jgi:O-antigen/teichoic acid export membrane protein
MSEFRQKTVSGITWSVVSQVGRQVLTFVISVILARLLSPREFGLVAMVTVITNFAGIFAELGFSSALVQKKDVRQEHLSSVFWLNLGAGLLLTALFMAGAPLMASFYGEPLLLPVTMLIATDFVISALTIVQNTLLTKSLDFKTLSIVEITAVGLAGIVAIGMAVTGFGVWSLAVQSLVFSAVSAALLWRFGNWRPALIFRWNAVKELLGFSMHLFGTQTLNYWARNIDYLLIGRYLGTSPLGAYNRAYSVMLFPLSNVSRVLSRVMFPSFSMIQDDRLRIKDIFLRMTRIIALITFPMMLGLFVTVEPFVLTVFGPKWVEMIPVLRVFCLVGMIQSIVTLIGNLYLSQGRTEVQFRLGLFTRATSILGIVVGLRWGIVGVAIGYSIAATINLYPNVFFAGRLVNLTFSELLQNLRSVFACAVTMAGIVWAVGLVLPIAWPDWARLMAQVSLGFVTYIALVHLLRVQAYREGQTLVLEQWRLYRQRRSQPVRETI